MKKIYYECIVMLLSCVVSVNAQPAGMGKNDPEAKKVLDAVSAKFKTFKSVQSSFSLKIENSAGKIPWYQNRYRIYERNQVPRKCNRAGDFL